MKTIFFTIILFLTVIVKSQDLQINEVVSRNYNGLLSFQDETEDWIEIYNNSSDTINLSNYFLSDNEQNLQKWQFPQVEILPDSFLIIFASGNNFITPEIHASFKLSSEGEKLFLSSLQIIDSVSIVNLSADYSFGRIDEHSNEWSLLDVPSPGASNSASNHLLFSDESGFYNKEFHLTIEALKSNHTIRYTLDGSEPTENSLVFSESLLIKNATENENNFCNIITTVAHEEIEEQHQIPLVNINKANVLKVASFYNHKKTSKTYSRSYFVNNSDYEIPIISIISEVDNFFDASDGIYVAGDSWDETDPAWTGNYTLRGRETEKLVNISFFDEDKNLVFEQNAGARIHGGLTRTKPQKSLRLYARKDYGVADFDIPFFAPLKYDKFVLKGMFSSWNKTLVSDYLALKSAENLDLEQQHFKPVIVYLNGEYWGIHLLGERIDDDFLKEKLSLNDQDSINLLSQGVGYDIYGSNTSFKNLISFIEQNDLAQETNYNFVSSQIDIDNFITYHIFEMFFNNIDWPMNNIKFWNAKYRKWRYILFDLDGGTHSFNYGVDWNMFTTMTALDGEAWPNPPESNLVFRKLITNEGFKNKFIDRYVDLLNNELSYKVLKENFDEIIPTLQKHLPEHIERWNNLEDMAEWEYLLKTKTLDFIEQRPCIVNEQMEAFFQLKNSDYDCVFEEYDLTFSLYPNPTSNNINIEFLNQSQKPSYFNYKIFNNQGATIYEGGEIVLNDVEIELPTSLKGLYFIQIFQDDIKPRTKKFIVL